MLSTDVAGVEPGQLVTYRIPLVPNARRFARGHRIPLVLASDDNAAGDRRSGGASIAVDQLERLVRDSLGPTIEARSTMNASATKNHSKPTTWWPGPHA